MGKDYYKILGVDKNSTPDDIKKAYRKLARKYHPDVNQNNKVAEEKFKEISEAYEILSNPEKKNEYDQFGAYNFGQGSAGGGFRDFSGFDFKRYAKTGQQGGFQSGNFDFSDIFENVFNKTGRGGDFYSYGNFGGNFRKSDESDSVEEVEKEIEIDFKEAVSGVEKYIIVNNETLKVKIPEGVDNGSKIRLAGKGGSSPFSNKRGNLILKIKVKDDPVCSRRGRDLYLKTPITLKEAFLGGEIEVLSPTGKIKLKIPQNTSGGKRFRVKGKGVKDMKSKLYGDLYIEVYIVLPDAISADFKKCIESLDYKVR